LPGIVKLISRYAFFRITIIILPLADYLLIISVAEKVIMIVRFKSFLQGLIARINYVDIPIETEEESVIRELRSLGQKIEQAWTNFHYALPEFIDTSIMEIYRHELEYGILNRKLKLLNGDCEGNRDIINSREHLEWLRTHIQKDYGEKEAGGYERLSGC